MRTTRVTSSRDDVRSFRVAATRQLFAALDPPRCNARNSRQQRCPCRVMHRRAIGLVRLRSRGEVTDEGVAVIARSAARFSRRAKRARDARTRTALRPAFGSLTTFARSSRSSPQDGDDRRLRVAKTRQLFTALDRDRERRREARTRAALRPVFDSLTIDARPGASD